MKTSLVTGSTKGIGLATAKALVREGGAVMITARDAAAVERAVNELAALAPDRSRVAGRAADVRDRSSVDALVAETVSRFGGLDIVVNNAARGLSRSLEATTDDEWREVFETNVTGAFFVTRAAIPALRRRGGGWIINIASLAGRNPFPNGSAYCASKAALIAMTESVMQEVRYDGIRVSVILPGSVATEFTGPRKGDDSWKLAAEDVAETIVDLVRHPSRSLPSRIELRPSQPPAKK
jgi:NAD(P)-dependent dehydrogenase (short-subunit alcohol dehydrogenase family)